MISQNSGDDALISMVYISSAVRPFENAELLRMLSTFKANNERAGISGILLYKDRSFLQVLEGPSTAVHACYQKILRDPRHTNIAKVIEHPIEERAFGQWSMGFRSIGEDAPTDIEGFSQLLHNGAFDANHVRTASRRTYTMIRAFLSAIR